MAAVPTATRRPRFVPFRRAGQIVFLGLFLFLFSQTDYQGRDEIDLAVNLFFRVDPLAAMASMLAARGSIPAMLPGLAVVGLTLFLGRFFCGWFCPMGTCLDLFRRFVIRQRVRPRVQPRWLRDVLLVVILVGALTGLPLIGWFDPFSILVRGLAVSVQPAADLIHTTLYGAVAPDAPAWLYDRLLDPFEATIRKTLLPFRPRAYAMAWLSLVCLTGVFSLEFEGRRFFCRFVCPLGALVGRLARPSPWRIHGTGGGACSGCRACRSICRMGAMNDNLAVQPEHCILCLDCLDACPKGVVAWGRARPEGMLSPPVVALSRRQLLGAVLGGALLPAFLKSEAVANRGRPWLLRPPGARPEPEFLGLCLRCGECMKVCIGNALHPALLESGIEGVFSPRLIPRLGYCEYQCTLCGQVCPTGAIERLPLGRKVKERIGSAFFDKNRCLPYAKGVPCIVCEEHCPTPKKAILFRELDVPAPGGGQTRVKQPFVEGSLCIGCGICETKCPLPGEAAIRVTSAGESRAERKGTATS